MDRNGRDRFSTNGELKVACTAITPALSKIETSCPYYIRSYGEACIASVHGVHVFTLITGSRQ